jgi:hypothetical protein
MPDGPGELRVAVYFVTDDEGTTAEEILGGGAERFANVFEGTVDADGLEALVDAGLTVEQLAGSGPPPGPTWDPELIDTVTRLQAEGESAPLLTPPGGTGALDTATLGDEPPGLAGDGPDPGAAAGPVVDAPPAGEVHRIELRGPITREQHEGFAALGVDITAFEPPRHYRTFLTEDQVRQVEALDHVAAVSPYTFEEKLTPELVAMLDRRSSEGPSLAGDLGDGAAPGSGAVQQFDCLVHREEDLPRIRDLVAAIPTTRVVGTSNLRVRFAAGLDLPLLGALAARPEVRQLTVFTPPAIVGSPAAGAGSHV